MKVFSDTKSYNEHIIKIFNIPVYYKHPNKLKLLGGAFKIKKDDKTKKYYILGIQFKKTKPSIYERLDSKDLLYKQYAIEEARNAIIVADQHKKVFPQFKNIHKCKKVAIVGAAPSLQHYTPIKDLIHISLNRVFTFNKIKFDYIFAVDYKGIKDYVKELIEYKCTKFLGQYINSGMAVEMKIPEYIIEDANAYKFYSDNKYFKIKTQIYQDISSAPLMDFYSIAFCALHFAFWTHPKTIYIIGCDCSPNGYFDKSKQRESNAKLKEIFSVVINGYKKLKDFRDSYYPDVEIISVNPVGLRGMFRDVYTQSYLDANPDIAEELGSNIEILDENTELN